MTEQNQPYYLRLTIRDAENKEVFFSNENETTQPLEITPGQNQIFPKVEALIPTMEIGDRQQVTLKKEEAFGDTVEEAIQVIPIDNLPEQLREAGANVSAQTEQGESVNGQVISVDAENAQIDFNHPLAGKAIEVDFFVVEKPQ